MTVRRTIAALERKRHSAKLFRLARERTELSRPDVAAIASVCKARVQAWEDDEECAASAPIHLLLDPTLGPALLSLLAAEHGLRVVEAEALERQATDAEQLATLLAETSDATVAYAQAAADGTITAAEAARVEREGREAVIAINSVVARMQAIQRGAQVVPIGGKR